METPAPDADAEMDGAADQAQATVAVKDDGASAHTERTTVTDDEEKVTTAGVQDEATLKKLQEDREERQRRSRLLLKAMEETAE